MLPAMHTLTRFEQAKEQFKQQICHNVDTLFKIFVSELNTGQHLTTSSNINFTNDTLRHILDTDALQKSFNDHAVAQQKRQQCLNANESFTDIDQLAAVPSADDQLVSDNERSRVHEENLNRETQQNDQSVIQTSDQLVQNNLQQLQSQSAQFSIKQEILDEDEQLNEAQYNMNNDDANCRGLAHDDLFIEENIPSDYVPGCQCESCLSGITNHQEDYHDSTNEQNHQEHNSLDQSHVFAAPNNTSPCSYSMNDAEEIYDEELLREVKEEILEEQRINAMKRMNNYSNECDQIDASQVDISADQLTDDDRIINSNSISTLTQPIFPSLSTSSISSNSSVHSNYEQDEIPNCQTEQNTASNTLEDGELIDSDVDEHFNELDIPEKAHDHQCGNRESQNILSFTISARENPVPDKSSISSSLSNRIMFPTLDYDKFGVISEKCPSCDMSFGTQKELNGHMFKAHKLLPFACPFLDCSISKLSFRTKNELSAHFHHKTPNHSQMICSQCNKMCDSPMELFTHTYDNHRQGKFACVKGNCRKKFRFRRSAIQHYNQKHIDDDNQILTKILTREDNTSKERLIMGNQPIVRSPKRKMSNAYQEDKAHSNINAPFSVISVKCTEKECHSEFSSEIELANHLNIEHQIFYNFCPIERCPMSFKLRSELIRHSEVVHRNMHEFSCPKCEFYCSNFVLLYKHNFMDHHEGKFKCRNETCDYVGIFRNDTIKHYIHNHVYKNKKPTNI